MAPDKRCRRKRPNRELSKRTVVLFVTFLLGLSLVLSVVIGWFGLNPKTAEHLSPVGSESHELLNAWPDGNLVVEVDYQTGWAPPPSAIALLWERINETCQKSTVTFQEQSFSTSQTAYTDGDLWALETSVRQHWPTPGTMSLYYEFVGGSYAEASNVIGLAFRGSSIAVFPSVIQSSVGAFGNYDAYVATVMIHEFGHELGLVGIIGAAPNEDPAHPGHSTDPNDVMYWEVDSTGVIGLFGGGAPPNQFDVSDLSDLDTVRATPILQEVVPVLLLSMLWGLAVFLAVNYWRLQRVHRNGSISPRVDRPNP
jgi:hypothetical protein